MKFKNSLFSALMATALISGSVSAQEEKTDTSSNTPAWLEKVYAGAGVGLSTSWTDMKQYPNGFPVIKYRNELGAGINILAGYQFNNKWALEGNLSWLRVNGTDRSVPGWFTASVWQWDANARFNIANAVSKSTIESRKFDVYLLGGVGLSAFRSVARVLSQGVADQDPVFAQYGWTNTALTDKIRRTIELSFMGGIGASYRLNDKFDVYFDIKGYFLNSDKLDATIGAANNDRYNYNTLGVIYHFGGTGISRKIDKEDPAAKLDEILSKFEDDDADGVPNYQDKDLNTPAGVKVYPDGTAIDTDGDGVADYKDQEKISPCKEVDANGVAKDTDKDGVADCNDVEPNTKEGAQVDGKGKAIVTSPAVSPLTVPSEGGEASSASTGVMSGLPPVFFASNSSSISYKNYESLTQVAQFLKANASAKLVIAGNSDKIGSEEYNKVLAEKRAKAVVDYLVKNNGIDASRLSVVSNGSKNTISTKRNSQQDRRVDFLLSK